MAKQTQWDVKDVKKKKKKQLVKYIMVGCRKFAPTTGIDPTLPKMLVDNCWIIKTITFLQEILILEMI